MNQVVLSTHCPCGVSSDAFKIYDTGDATCYSGNCPHRKDGKNAYFFKDQVDQFLAGSDVTMKESKPSQFIKGFFTDIKTRGISKATCEFFGYEIGKNEFGEYLQIANHYDQHGEVIGQKYRTKEKEFFSEGDISNLYGKHLWKGGKYIVITEGECLDKDTEVLTPNGWIHVDSYNGGPIGSVDTLGILHFKQPLAYVVNPSKKTNFIQFKNKYLNFKVTEGHRIPVWDKKTGLVRFKVAGKLRKAMSSSILRTSVFEGNGVGLTKNQLKLVTAIQADGSIKLRKNGNIYCHFGFKKQRKIDRLVECLDYENIKFTLNKGKDYTYISFTCPTWVPFKNNDKLWPVEWVGLLTLEDRQFLLNELKFWDGNSVNNRTYWEYSTKSRHNADFIQTISHTSGYVSSIISRSNTFGSWYKLTIGKHNYTSLQNLEKKVTRVTEPAPSYCFQTEEGMLLVRRHGQIHVTGNCDALAFAEATACRYPVVSIPQGCNSAKKSIQKDIKWLEDNFEQVILFFDNDEAGRKALEEVTPLFYPGKCATYTPTEGKDANDLLLSGHAVELAKIAHHAKTWQPQGITTIKEVRKLLGKPIERGLSYPWEKLSDITFGIRLQELIFLGAGTGMGKTEIYKEIITHLRLEHNEKIGVLFLEESNEHTARCLAGKAISKPLHIPTIPHTQEDIERGLDLIEGKDEIVLYNHFGYQDYESVKSAIKYMVTAMDCKYIFLDHITALVSGDYDSDERKLLDYICTDLASMVRRYNFSIFAISHLATAAGVPHEEGGRVQLKHLRGSRAIGQWANFVFALEKNQQNPEEKNQVLFRVLKDRLTGQATGETFVLHYNPETGRITETPTTGFGEPIDLF